MVTDNEQADIEAWLAEAEAGEEPGESLRQKIIHRGDDTLDAPMKILSLESAGYSKVYHQETGEMSLINNNMLKTQLLKKLPDGRRAFGIHPPEGVTPFVGTFKCMLHPDDPKRSIYDELGFAVCRKSNMPNAHQVVRHMQHRHKIEWAAIQEMKRDSERAEDREYQQKLYAAMTGVKTEEKQEVEEETPSDEPVVATTVRRKRKTRKK